MNEKRDIEDVLRRILSREIRLHDLRYEEDLIELDPEFPTEEVLKDVLEEFGFRRPKLQPFEWSGSFADLLRIIEEQIEMREDTIG